MKRKAVGAEMEVESFSNRLADLISEGWSPNYACKLLGSEWGVLRPELMRYERLEKAVTKYRREVSLNKKNIYNRKGIVA